MSTQRYRIPVAEHRVTTTVSNSRFITTIDFANTTELAKGVLNRVRNEMPDASHHVYAFRVGFSNSVIEGMSDDGEPTGTAGPPVLSVLRRTEIGDIIVVVTRYFGGTKLGTGGLVRAYSDAARVGLETVQTEEKIPRKTLGIEVPYPIYELVKRLVASHQGHIEDESFTGSVTLIVRFPAEVIENFTDELREMSAGQVEPVVLSET